MKRKGFILMFCMIVSAVFMAAPVFSQDTETKKAMRDKIRADKRLVIAANMDLNEAEGKAFWPIYDAYQKDYDVIIERAGKLLEMYVKNYTTMTGEVAKRILDDQIAVEMDKLKLRQDYLPKFRKALPDIKVTRYYQMENKIQAIINYELADAIPLVE